MLAFRKLLARRAPMLRFSSSASNFDYLEALSIEDQIEGIDKSLGDLNIRINICESTIQRKSEAVRKVLCEIKKEPFEYVPQKKSDHPSRTPDAKKMLKALEKLKDLVEVPEIDDCASGPPDVTKIAMALETWEMLKNGFEGYYSPMRDAEKDLKLLASVRIMQARVNDVRIRLGNNKE